MSVASGKALTIALAWLMPCLLFSQQGLPAPYPPHSGTFDSVVIKWSGSEWFGKSRMGLGSYASAKYKTGISSSSNRVFVDGREELMSKMPFRVELQDSTAAKFKIQGKKYWTSGYWQEESDGIQSMGELLNLPEVLTTSETYVGDNVNIELKDAELSHSLQADDIWKFHLKRNPSTGAILQEMDAYLSNGSRIIGIRGAVQTIPADTMGANQPASFYEFIEEGKVIAWASRQESVVYFPVNTPIFTRSLLLTAILAMSM
jgi:hypothetical protein